MKTEIFGTQEIIILLIFLIPIALLGLGIYLDSKKKSETFTLETRDYTIVYIYAPFGSRFWAHLIDVLIICIPSYFIPILPAWIYWSIQESSKERNTFGKQSQKLFVMTTEGKRISFWKASGRFIGLFLTTVFTFSIGFLFMFTNEKKQCLHDVMTSTVVVKEIQRIKKANHVVPEPDL